MLASLERDRQIRAERMRHVSADITRWKGRQKMPKQQVATLKARLDETRGELETYAELPQKIAKQRDTLLIGALSNAESERKAAADKLVEAEAAVKSATQALRTAQTDVTSAREAKARIEAKLENARQRRQDEARRIRETFEVAPEDCLKMAAFAPGDTLPALARHRQAADAAQGRSRAARRRQPAGRRRSG